LPVFTVEEGGNVTIDMEAKANPPIVEYKWTNPDRATIPAEDDALPGSRLVANGGKLTVTNARRTDRGKYKVRASNAEGKASAKFILDVQYGPR